jgi:copper resistance protein D
LDDPLIYARAVHFAATITVAGVVFFIVLIAEPALRGADAADKLPNVIRRRLKWMAWVALLLTVASGAAWLVIAAQAMSDLSLPEVLSEGILWTVLTQTGFGHDWLVRTAMSVVFAAIFVSLLSPKGIKSIWIKIVAVVLAAALVGSLAWAGHAAGGTDSEAIIHPVADVLHLIAAAAWVGMLVPLALLLAATTADAASAATARIATVRFSNIGVISVGTLLITGSINTWYLSGSVAALTQTDYGQLLLTKVALFLVMVAIAAVNRLRLTPRLVQNIKNIDAAADALRQLRRNTIIEVIIGAVIIAIVAALGVTPPGHLEQMPHAHHHSD